MDNARGRCLCGDVAFVLAFPSTWCAHCPCARCRRAHGAGVVTWVGMAEDRVAIDDPNARLAWFASTPEARRGFCTRCGSSLFFRSTRWPGELHVARANIDDPVDRAPQAHAWWDAHVDWLALDPDDGLKRMPAPDASA